MIMIMSIIIMMIITSIIIMMEHEVKSWAREAILGLQLVDTTGTMFRPVRILDRRALRSRPSILEGDIERREIQNPEGQAASRLRNDSQRGARKRSVVAIVDEKR